MSELILNGNTAKESILAFEELLSEQDGAVKGDSDLCPLKHSFSEGMYVREIFIPKGTVLTGKIHKHEHPNFLMSGEVEMFTEFGGYETIKAPMAMISKAGTKRVIKALTDVVWVTVHANPSNTKDLKKLENIVIAKDYNEYKRFIGVSKVKRFFKNILKLN